MRHGASIAVIVALLTASGLAAAASGSGGTIEDEKGDVSAQHLVTAGLLPAELPKADAETVGDVVSAQVASETSESIRFTVTLAEIPDDENISSPLMEVWTHFTTGDLTYHVEAELATPQEGTPLEARYQLYEASSPQTTLTGTLDRETDQVSFTVPKGAIGDPVPGDMLREFYISTHLPQEGLEPASSPVLDYAPSAKTLTLTQETDPTQLNPVILGLGPELSYGSPYEFGSFEGASDLDVTLSPPSLETEAGDTGYISITVLNRAPKADTVHVSVGNVPSGWSVSSDKDTLTVEPDKTESATLTIKPAEGADGQRFIHVRLTSDMGADQLIQLSVDAEQPEEPAPRYPQDPSGGTSDASTRDEQPTHEPAPALDEEEDEASASEEGSEEQNGSPSPAAWLVATAMGAVAWAARRRR